MSAAREDLYGDVLSASPSALAETALRQLDTLIADGASAEEIREVTSTAVSLLNMHQRSRGARGRKAWLAKVTSFAFPRTFSTGPLPKTDNVDVLVQAGRRHHHVCFTVQISDGTKPAVGREVEVQVPADDAIRLGQQMARIATKLLPAAREGEQTSPIEGDQMT